MRLQSLLFFLLLPFVSVAQSLPALIPITNGEKWGYADTAGRIVIPLQWEEAAFFEGGKAMVTPQREPKSPLPHYALINEQGSYIIPPAAGWNGMGQGGWGTMNLNAVDAAGRWGLIDTGGNLQIPYQWDYSNQKVEAPLHDSFKIVNRGRLWGVLAKGGALAIPPNWSGVKSTKALSALRAFLVQDRDNAAGANSWGVVDLENRVLVPTRYSEIEVVQNKEGKTVFKAHRAAENQSVSGGGFRSALLPPAARFLSYPEGHILQMTDSDLYKADVPEQHFPGGFIGSNHGRELLDSNRKVVVPCCNFWKIQGDTIFLRDGRRTGEASVVFKIQFLSLATRKPLRPPHEELIYQKNETSLSFPSGRTSLYPEPRVYRIPTPYLDAAEYFYKDTFLYQVVGQTASSPRYYLVRSVTTGRENSDAVVNERRAYTIPPQSQWHLESYDAPTGLAIARRTDLTTGNQVYTLIDTNGKVQITPQQGKIVRGIWWKGNCYAILQTKDARNPNRAFLNTLINSAGIPVPAFENRMVSDLDDQHYYYSDLGQTAHQKQYSTSGVWVQDLEGRRGILRPDGTTLHEALNFKYTQLDRTFNGWFLARETKDGNQFLIDHNNKNLLPGLSCMRLEEPQRNFLNGGKWYKRQEVPRIFGARVKSLSTNKEFLVYVDDRGRPYYVAP